MKSEKIENVNTNLQKNVKNVFEIKKKLEKKNKRSVNAICVWLFFETAVRQTLKKRSALLKNVQKTLVRAISFVRF